MFKVGEKYSRKDIYNILQVPLDKQKGSWNTGYRSYKGKYYIFAGINTAGRTGHDYGNYWKDNLLYWRGKNRSHINQPSIKKLLDNKTEVNIFTRTDNNSVYFKYQGKGQAVKWEDTIPVTIYWGFDIKDEENSSSAELAVSVRYSEGAVKSVLVNAYERNKKAREKCLHYYGYKCSVCGLEFKKVYGNVGDGFMHVHHLKMIHEIGEKYEVDPIKDLRPVCPNCHAMIHKKIPPFTIEEMRRLIKF